MQREGTRNAEAGLTLVEVLVVLVMVGILTGLTSLSIGRLQSGPSLERTAETLATRLTLAAERALYTGHDAALAWAEGGYRFHVRGPDGWAPHDVPLLAQVERLSGAAMGEGLSREGGLVIAAGPGAQVPARLKLTGRGGTATVVFDGLAAHVEMEASR